MNDGRTPDHSAGVTTPMSERSDIDTSEVPTTGEALWAEAVAAAVLPVAVLVLAAARNWPAFWTRRRADFAPSVIRPRSTAMLAYLKTRGSRAWRS